MGKKQKTDLQHGEAIPEYHRDNFQTLLRAAQNDHLCLISCKDAVTGEPRYVIAAVVLQQNGEAEFTPFGHLSNGDPYEEYIPPEGDINIQYRKKET
jgi:hypothetical protein